MLYLWACQRWISSAFWRDNKGFLILYSYLKHLYSVFLSNSLNQSSMSALTASYFVSFQIHCGGVQSQHYDWIVSPSKYGPNGIFLQYLHVNMSQVSVRELSWVSYKPIFFFFVCLWRDKLWSRACQKTWHRFILNQICV